MNSGPSADRFIELGLSRALTASELSMVLDWVGQAGFSSQTRERARGCLAGMEWQGRPLSGSDLLEPATVHYLWHVVHRREWPDGTNLAAYTASISAVILDPDSGCFVGRYLGVSQLGIVRESRDLRGPRGHDWLTVQYRVGFGHWVTAYQPEVGLDEFRKPQWSDVTWLRQPTRSTE